jgi:hypothetical protein
VKAIGGVGTILFLVIGVALLGVTATVLQSTISFLTRTTPVEGVIVEVGEARSVHGEPVSTAVVEWSGPDGQKHQQTTVSDGSFVYTPGQKLPLRFDPANPANAQGDNPGSRWFGVAILAALGIAFTTIAVRVGLKSWRARTP